jgi:hypothetical protein
MLMRLNRSRGVATVEFFLVALLALLPLCLGMLQTGLLLVSNHHVDHAAFMAARTGATHQGDAGAMQREFARALTPLFVTSAQPLNSGNVVARVLGAQARAFADVTAFGSLRVLSPNGAAQQDFAQRRNAVQVIPSDSLQHRSVAPGRASGQSLQQANILRVEFTYCQPMIVPFVRDMMVGLLRRIDPDPGHQRCYADGRVPLRSVGTAPMQSDYRVGS